MKANRFLYLQPGEDAMRTVVAIRLWQDNAGRGPGCCRSRIWWLKWLASPVYAGAYEVGPLVSSCSGTY